MAHAAGSAAQCDQRAPAEEVSGTTEVPAVKERRGASPGAAGLQWDLPEGISASKCLWLWIGQQDAPALTELLLTHSRCICR